MVLSESWGYAVECNATHKWACFMEPFLKCKQKDLAPFTVKKEIGKGVDPILR